MSSKRSKLVLRLLLGALLLSLLPILHLMRKGQARDSDTPSPVSGPSPDTSLATGIVTAAGTPLAHLSVVFTPFAGSPNVMPKLGRTDELGRLSVPLDPKTHYVLHPLGDAYTGSVVVAPPHKGFRLQLTALALLHGLVSTSPDTPVPNAAVRCEERKTGSVHLAVTDREGRFRFRLPPLVFCSLFVVHRDFLPAEPVLAAPESGEVEIRLLPRGTLTVEVIDEAGHPLPDAEVALTGPGLWPPLVDRADTKGIAVFKDLQPGIFSVAASHGRLVAEMEAMEIEAGVSTVVHITLSPGVFLYGLVRDRSNDKPLPGALFSLSGEQPSLMTRHRITGDDGRFKIGPLVAGGYRFSLAAPGYVAVSGRRYWVAKGNEIALFELSKGITIRGRVIDDVANPVRGAQVEVWGMGWTGELISPLSLGDPDFTPSGDLGVVKSTGKIGLQATGAVLTDEEGRFELHGIPPGWLALRVLHQDHVPAYRRLGSTEKDTASLEIRLNPGGKMDVTLVNDIGEPVSGAEVRVESPDEPAYSYTVFSSKEGTFSLTGAPGHLTLTYRHPDYPVKSETIRLVRDYRATLPYGRQTITLLFRDGGGFNIKDAQVELRSIERSEVHEGKTNADGAVTFGKIGDGAYRAYLTHGSYPPFRSPRLKPGSHSFTIPFGGGLKLFIRDKDTKSGIPAEVILSQRTSGFYQLTTARGGELELTDLPAGLIQVTLHRKGYATLSSTVEIQAGSGPSQKASGEAIWEMTRAGVVKGMVRDDLGHPVRSARVVYGDRVAYSDGYGRFTLRNLPPGRLTLTAWHAATGLGTEEVTVESDQETTNTYIDLKERPGSGAELQSGVSITKEPETGAVLVDSIAAGSPAARTALKTGMELISINGLPTGLPLPFLQRQLQGRPGEALYLAYGERGVVLGQVFIRLTN